ncbi:MAG TPA: restriction endonuclease [Terriglobales bacterium]|nr:restriction endonuclease [Terriglobales bacterium]
MTTDSTSTRVPGQVISPAAYAALGEALTAIIWNKDAFERHVRGLLRGRPELLVHLNFSDIKRVVADELVDQLMADEDRYQEFTLWLMNEVASMESFPNLERQRKDRALHLDRAQKAIADLRRFTMKYAAERGEQQEMREEFARWRAAAEGQQGFSRALEELKAEFLAMQTSTNPQQRGRDFERFLYKLFRLFDLEPRLSYDLAHEQIDGALTFDTDDYIIEAKWWQEAVERKDVADLCTKISDKGKNTLGLFISVSGFSHGARETYSTRTSFITLDGEDLFYILDQRIRLDEVLRHKKRHASETGSCFYPAREILANG